MAYFPGVNSLLVSGRVTVWGDLQRQPKAFTIRSSQPEENRFCRFLLGASCFERRLLLCKTQQRHSTVHQNCLNVKKVIFTPNPGEMIQFDFRMFLEWVVQPPSRSSIIQPFIF